MLTLSSEEKQFISRLDDLLERVEERYQEAVTDFLEPRLQLVAEEYLRSRKIQRYLFCGGYEGAERKRLVLFPEYSEPDCELAKISLFRFQGKLDFVSVNHRDFLGAVMGLGLRREKFGDLLVRESGFDLFVQQEAAEYLEQQELRVKHVPLKGEEYPLAVFEPPQQNIKEIHIMVASMRLDTVLAHGFQLSRSKAMELIQGGQVKVNHSEITENDYLCRQGDLISCRGKGRIAIGALAGETRKGNLKLCILKYI